MKPILAMTLFLAVASGLRAGDLPQPLTEDERAEVMQRWRKHYNTAVAQAQNDLADAKLARNRAKIASLTKDLEQMKRDPLKTRTVNTVFQPIYTGQPKQMGWLYTPSLTVNKIVPEGVIVEGSFAGSRSAQGGIHLGPPGRIVVRYLIASPLANAKPGARVKLDGLWQVAGLVEMDQRELPVLYRFDVKEGSSSSRGK